MQTNGWSMHDGDATNKKGSESQYPSKKGSEWVNKSHLSYQCWHLLFKKEHWLKHKHISIHLEL